MKDFFKYIVFHKWNKLSEEQISFLEKSGINNNLVWKIIKKLNHEKHTQN